MYPKRRLSLLYFVIALALVGLACGVGKKEEPERPSVVINSPADGSTATLGMELTIASTSFSKNGVSQVELRINGQAYSADAPLGEPESHVANLTWTPQVEGAVTISVVTTDVEGNASDPASISVQVVQPGEAPPDEPGTDPQPPADTEVPPPPADTEVPPTPTITQTPEPGWTMLPVTIPVIPLNIFNTNIIGMGIQWNYAGGEAEDKVYTLYDFQYYSIGSSRDLDEIKGPNDCDSCLYDLPAKTDPEDIIDIAIADGNYVYYFFRDGTVSVGTISDYNATIDKGFPYSLPPGKTPDDIVGLASTCDENGDGDIYAWYKDGTVSSGIAFILDSKRKPYPYSLPPGKTPESIVGIGIACSDDHVYVWYNDGTVSSGTSSDLDAYRDPQPYTVP